MEVINQKTLLLTAVILLAFAGIALAQKYLPDPEVLNKIKACTQEVTLIGKIGYALKHGGYYVKNNPRHGFGDKVILNQNPKVLKELASSGRTVTLRGRVSPTDFLAHYLFLESVGGRSYHGRRAPLVPFP
jgi:hypothetical protein